MECLSLQNKCKFKFIANFDSSNSLHIILLLFERKYAIINKGNFVKGKGVIFLASWIIHLRIADKVLRRYHFLPTEYFVGNIAPDSGIMNYDQMTYTPDNSISHFADIDKYGGKLANPNRFSNEYLTPEKIASYNANQLSFYVGYYNHLVTDRLWKKEIIFPLREKYADIYELDKLGTISKWKNDWYDLDCLFLRNNPDFTAFSVYESAVGFENSYLDFFSKTAFDEKRQHISKFYSAIPDNLDRKYKFTNSAQIDKFVDLASTKIIELNKRFLKA